MSNHTNFKTYIKFVGNYICKKLQNAKTGLRIENLGRPITKKSEMVNTFQPALSQA